MTTLVAVGDVLAGKYRVEKVLGIGGMGMVVAATHLELEQKVALKFMLPAALASEQAMDRFLREAKAAVRLKSEHICRVLDVGKLENSAPYIVMELMEGQDFAQLIKARGALPLVDAVDHVMQAIEGLAEAHANGIVHRDLKPGNLFVCADNDGSALVKVLDFGISKSSLGAGAMATKTGDIMGSPAYMAPEQMMSSKNVDARADVWALGVILYQAVTGTLPFEAETLPALCMSVMNTDPVAPDAVRAGLPPAFAAVVMRCLTKKPESRYGSVAELASALVPFGGDEAAGAAKRVGKVLARVTRTTPAVDAVASGVAPTLMTDSDAALTPMLAATVAPVPAGRISTLQASAAEISGTPAETGKKSRLGLFAGLGVLVVVAGIGVAAVTGGGGHGAQPAASPAAAVAPAAASIPAQTPIPAPAAAAVEPQPQPQPLPLPLPKPLPLPQPLAHKPRLLAHKPSPPPAPAPTPAPAPVVAPPPAPPPADPPKPAEDKWTHMQHDKVHTP